MLRLTCSAVRMPSVTLTTLGCVWGKAMAAAGRVVPWRSQTSAMACARAVMPAGASW